MLFSLFCVCLVLKLSYLARFINLAIPNTATNNVEISRQTDLAGNEDATVVDEMENILSNNES